MDDLTREFLIESQEGLDRMERCLTELEERPQDKELLAEIFRSVHTIKGTTGFLGFKRLEKLAHAGESLLGLLRDGKMSANAEVITALLHLLDGLRELLKAIEAEGNEGSGDDTALIARLEELQAPAQQAKARNASAVHQARETASVEVAERTAASHGPHQSEPVAAEPVHASSAHPATVVTPPPEPTEAAGEAAALTPAEASKARAQGATAESTLRVDVTLLNRMMNLVGELVLTRNQVLQATAADPNMTLLSRRLDMVTADLRESVMKARMQPVSNVFSKMPRLVRDLTHALGRRARLQMEGQETELDKSLLEAIKDPLTHAVRNSLDHGIEPPAVREAAGKDPEGTLRCAPCRRAATWSSKCLTMAPASLPKKFAARPSSAGCLRRSAPRNSASAICCKLIFLPGFSTAAQVTNVSGRGVGMDVVRTNVEKIGGKVEIDSRLGKGTTLRMRIPLTLAIIPALIVRSISQSFALPQGALSELVHIPPERAATAIEWMEGAPLYRLRGRLLPLVFLDRLLMPGRECKLSTERDNFIAVLDADGRRFGLIVDSLADPEEIVVKPLSAVLKDIGLFSGATVLGNADLALILDPGSIAMQDRGDHERRGRIRAGRGRRERSRAHALSAGGSRGPAGRGAAGRRAAHRAASVFADRIHRLPAGAQLRGPIAAGRGLGRHSGRGRGRSRGPDCGGRLPRRQSPCGHRGFARARRNLRRQPLRGRNGSAHRGRNAAEGSRDRRGRSGRRAAAARQ